MAAVVSVVGLVSQRDKRPYVQLLIDDKVSAQLTVAEARQIAGDLQRMAARAEADSTIFTFFERQQFPEGAGAAVMMDLREFRRMLDAEIPTRPDDD